MTSAYFRSLAAWDQARYLEKLNYAGRVNLPDPYDPRNASAFRENPGLFPRLSWPELHDCLINSPGKYTRERLKAYKSLDAYNYFLSGKVTGVLVHKPETVESVRVLLGRVRTGQTENKTCSAWAVTEVSGPVVAAHCTCMAGWVASLPSSVYFLCYPYLQECTYTHLICRHGEECSHVAALLFYVEAAVRTGLSNVSATSTLCSWSAASSSGKVILAFY